MNVSSDDFVRALTSAVQQFSEDVQEEVFDGLKKIGKETVKKVKENSPVYTGNSKKIKPEEYKKGWRCTVEEERGAIQVTVHNKKYQLVHLLENGHLNRDGTTRARAFPHVKQAEEFAEKEVEKLLKGL